MLRDRAFPLTIIILLLSSLACNAFVGSLEPFPPPPTAIGGKLPEEQLLDPVATVTLPALSPLSSARVKILVDLNVRSGPGVQYDRVGFILKDESVPILGIHKTTGWWKIECPEIADGTDCWVSGGKQYTQAEDIEGVVEADAPSTPTPQPPTLEEGLGIIAFVDGGYPYVAKIDLALDPPLLTSDPVQLAETGSVGKVVVSPDGRRIAFISTEVHGNNLYVVNSDGQDFRHLLNTADLPAEINPNTSEYWTLLDQISWLPDSTVLAFNTIAVNQTGTVYQEDLLTVDLDGKLQQLLPAGSGGGAFTLTSSNKILLSRQDHIVRTDLTGTNEEIILQFDPINTASEFPFYPKPQQIEQGDLFIAVPNPEPWQPDTWTNLWQIPVAGQVGQLGSVEGVSLFDLLMWSPDGNRLAYIQSPDDLDQSGMPRLVIADGNGIHANPYAGGSKLAFHEWAADSNKFIYSGESFFAVGSETAPPQQILLSPGQQTSAARWITDETFIAAAGFPESGSWDFHSSTANGENIILHTIQSDWPVFDIWLP